MENSSVNNTTQLNMGAPKDYGTIGQRNFRDYSAKQISAEISRNEYRKAIVSDDRMQQFRQAVYKMVSGWAMEDKVAVITEYGDRSFLAKYKNPSEEIVNKICTESIIVHLDPADLRQLYNDIGIKEKKLTKEISTINSEQYGSAAKIRSKKPVVSAAYLNTAGFQEIYEKYAKKAFTAKDYITARKNGDPSYSVPKELEKQYTNLRNELDDVLKTCFNKIEIQQIAFSMGIEIPEGTPFVKIRKWIINKTCLYVDLILGKSKKNFANAILDPKPYNTLLKYTSYAYVTGEPGLDPKEFNELKRKARQAQVAMKERLKMQSYNKNMMRSKEMADLTGGAKGGLNKVAKQLKTNDQGILKDASYEELATLAGKYGIDPTSKKNKNIGILKGKIYNAMLNEYERVKDLNKTRDKLISKGKTTREVDDLIAVHSSFKNSSVLKKPEQVEESKAEGLPIIHFHRNGNIVERVILSAVPVYLVGQSGAGVQGDIEKYFQKYLTRKDITADANDEEFITSKLSIGVQKGNALKNAKKTSKAAKQMYGNLTVTKKDLSDDDRLLYEFAKTMPFESPDPSKVYGGEIDSVIALFRLLQESYRIPREGIVYLLQCAGIYNQKRQPIYPTIIVEMDDPKNASYLDSIRMYSIYAFALASKKIKLAKFISIDNGNLYLDVKRLFGQRFGQKMRALGRAISNPFKTIISGVKNIAKVIAKPFVALADLIKKGELFGQWPKDPSELNEKDRPLYDSYYKHAFSSITVPQLLEELLSSRGNKLNKNDTRTFIDELRNSGFDDTNLKYVILAITAYIDNYINLYHLFMHLVDKGWVNSGKGKGFTAEGKKVHSRIRKLAVKVRPKGKIFGNVRSGIKNIFKNIKQIKENIKYKKEEASNNKESEENKTLEGAKVTLTESNRNPDYDKFDPRENAGQRLPIPKLEWVGRKYEDNEIIEVVPVYVANQLKDNEDYLNKIITLISSLRSGGEIDEKKYTEGIGGNVSNVEAYQRSQGIEPTKGKNRITLTKEPADIISEMASKGYTPKSHIFNGGKAEKGKSYTLKNEDLEWATSNNFKFATGGALRAVVGDSLNGKENPEIVSWTPNGINVNPIKSGPENGNSPLATDKLSKFASERILKHFLRNKDTQSASDAKKEADAEAKKEIQKEEAKRKKSKTKKIKENVLIKITDLTGSVVDGKSYINDDARSLGVESVFSMPAIPVMAVNQSLNGTEMLDTITSFMKSVNSHMTDLKLGLSNEVVTAPMGVGAITRPLMISGGIVDKVANIAGQVMDVAMDTMIDSLKANTGGTITRAWTGAKSISRNKIPRFATGGSGQLGASGKLARKSNDMLSVITGDASDPNNMFKGGAKPELVQSNTDIHVTPLNKTGDETKEKITRMTPSERANALATAISSHVIKYKYTLPSGSTDVSNVGEAIKVFNVKPGITDEITVEGKTTTVADMLMQIYNQLVTISGVETTNGEFLNTIASNSAMANIINSTTSPSLVSSTTNISKKQNQQLSSGNPFAGEFPSSLDSILGGN